jgi:NADH-quinone oxidoreductase subunit N
MPLDSLNIDFAAILPQILLAGMAISILVADFFLRNRSKSILGYSSIAGLLFILPFVWMTVDANPSFGGTVISDSLAAFFNTIFLIAGVLALIISLDYLKKENIRRGEYYYIVLFAVLGMMVIASSNDLLSFYVGLELMALSFYILVAFGSKGTRSVEGALKYFVLGALSSGILLYGISFAYGFGGTTNLMGIARQAARSPGPNPFFLLSIVLIAAGFSFKVALFPFHLWAPDAYEGAPTPVTALLSVGSKAAAFAVFLRIFTVAFPAFQPDWSKLLWLLSAATMMFGSVVAISQKNIIRMMAYSSIAHAGIILMGLLVYNQTGISAILYYLLVYTFMNMGAFTVIALLPQGAHRGEYLSDYTGLSSHHPLFAFYMALFLLSLAGVPPTGGFAAKFFILASAVNAGYYWLASIGVVASAIALFFYAKVIFYMYMKEPEEVFEMPRASLSARIGLLIAAAGTVIPGVYPAPFMEMAINAVKPLLS